MKIIPASSGRSSLSYFVTGGTLPRDAACYVRRKADNDLLGFLQQLEFCFVLTARQMGKSSLMVHTATQLRQQGFTVALLDLTAIGQNLTPVQWYRGMLGRLGRQLDVEDELDERWEAGAKFGGLQRWAETLGDVLLGRFSGPIVLFVDEIDAVRSLPFSTDEFFAAIRECYNRRADNPEYKRLTFCVLGVATPSELVQDPRHTPFNIGHRIEMNDFTRDEVMLLAPGFVDQGSNPATARRLLERIHYWTAGHPYLTQRLCQNAVEAGLTQLQQIDRLCEEIFFGRAFHKRDDNILFVQDRLLRGSSDVAATLDLYQKVLSGKRCVEGKCGDSDELLRLAGIVRTDSHGVIKPRNRIYRHVFNRQWTLMHLPDAELRRQRIAFQRGLVRALSISSVVFLAISYFGYRLIQSERRALLAESGVRQQLFVSDMNLTQQSLAENHVARAIQLLSAHGDNPQERDRFEWRYLWSQCHSQKARFVEPAGGAVAFHFSSADGTLLSARAADLSVCGWEQGREEARFVLPGIPRKAEHAGVLLRAAFSPDGTRLARGYGKAYEIVTLSTGQAQKIWVADGAVLTAIAFSQDGKFLLTGDYAGTIRLWDVVAGKEMRVYRVPGFKVAAVTLSRDNRVLAATGFDGDIVLWETNATHPKFRRRAHPDIVRCARFSPDGTLLATGGQDGITRLWNVASGKLVSGLQGHASQVNALEFSPDGKLLASASADQTVRIWRTDLWETSQVIQGHTDRVTTLAFSPDGQRLATGSLDNSTAIWNVRNSSGAFQFAPSRDHFQIALAAPSGDGVVAVIDLEQNLRIKNSASGQEIHIPLPTKRPVKSLSISHDGNRFFTVDEDGVVVLGDTANRATLRRISGHRGATSTAYSQDDRFLAIGSESGVIWVLDAQSGALIHEFKLPAGSNIYPLSFSPNGKQFAAGNLKDGSLYLIDIPTQLMLTLAKGNPDGRISELTYSPDGRYLATGGFDAMIRIWPLTAKDPAAASYILEGNPGGVYALTFSPDGRTLASGGFNGVTRLWDVAIAREVLRIPCPDASDSILSLRFDHTGNNLTTVYQNGLLIRRTATP
jgi:WD40 repeat protein